MKEHWKYLLYILKHKWFVFIAGIKLHVPIYLLLLHDLSKFRFSEWFAYQRRFYSSKDAEPDAFNLAWLKHQHRNPHHWQYWLLYLDDGSTCSSLSMPEKFIREMVADWAGAGRAITGRWDVQTWYEKQKSHISLHVATKEKVEQLLKTLS
jgi:hypothetical protein